MDEGFERYFDLLCRKVEEAHSDEERIWATHEALQSLLSALRLQRLRREAAQPVQPEAEPAQPQPEPAALPDGAA